MRLMTKKEMKQFLKEVNKRKKFREALLQLVKNRSMNKPEIKTVYVPVNTDEPSLIVQEYQREITVDLVKDVEGYFFTPEQLNEYTQKVIKQALEIAAERAYALVKDHDLYIREYVGTEYSVDIDMSEGSPLQYGCSVITDKESITNTFEEIFNKFSV